MVVIDEAGLYRMAFGSRLSSAEKFTDWVASEILPSIRKHGAYMTEQVLEQALTSPEFLIRLATQLKEEQEKSRFLAREIEQKTAVIEEMQPKATYYDMVLQSDSLMSTTEIAKDYGRTWNSRHKKMRHHETFLYAKIVE